MSRRLKFFPLKGGLDTETPPISKSDGCVIDVFNYECVSEGGYRRRDGYERFDGRTLPSETIHYTVAVTITGTVPAVPFSFTATPSTAEGVVLKVEADRWVVMHTTTATIKSGDTLSTSAPANIATADEDALKLNADTIEELREYRKLASEYQRSLIAAVPGSGAIRGVWVYNGDVYAFRDNAAGTECIMHKATATGWVVVSTPTLSPGGRYEFVNYNFKASSGTTKMYGVDGVNKGFEFDGTTFTQISTGMAVDTPIHVFAHKKHLFYAFAGGSVQHSAVGDPTTWSVVSGAGEIGIGEEITGFANVPGEAMAIFGRNSTHILYGSSASDWNLTAFSLESGAIEGSLQNLRDVIYLDDRGVTSLSSVQSYGDFKASTITDKLRRVFDIISNDKVVCSVRVREKNQYRLYFDNKLSLVLTLTGNKLVGGMIFYDKHQMSCAVSCEDSTGNEVMYAGSDDGFVYRLDSGLSLDGETIEAYVRLMFSNFGTPENMKRFFKASLEIHADEPFSLAILPMYSYGQSDLPSASEQQLGVDGVGAAWDGFFSQWDNFFWDGAMVPTAAVNLNGSGQNLSLLIKSETNDEKPHILQGVTVHYSVRKVMR